jgi:DNA-binding protein H-NS
MRKPRDVNAELQALIDKTKTLKEKKTRQLGELVAATGADALDIETLAGALLALIESGDPARKESWRKRGQAFFQRRKRGAAKQADGRDASDQENQGGGAPT